MKAAVIILVLCALAGDTLAQTATPETKPSCKAQAPDKKLVGVAKVGFTKKCVTDAVGN